MTKNFIRKGLVVLVLMTKAASAWADSTTVCVDLVIVEVCRTVDDNKIEKP